jgi:hypothetical protein
MPFGIPPNANAGSDNPFVVAATGASGVGSAPTTPTAANGQASPGITLGAPSLPSDANNGVAKAIWDRFGQVMAEYLPPPTSGSLATASHTPPLLPSFPYLPAGPPAFPNSPSPVPNPVAPISPGESGDPSDVLLRRGCVPKEMATALLAWEYQPVSDWTNAALRARHISPKIKNDSTKRFERDLEYPLWSEAVMNIISTLRTASRDTPDAAAHQDHADQLFGHMKFMADSLNEDYRWSDLLRYDRALRETKAIHHGFNLNNLERTLYVFNQLVIRGSLGNGSCSTRTPPLPRTPTAL